MARGHHIATCISIMSIYLLDDDALKAEIQIWVNTLLGFRNNYGWIGPIHPEPGKRYDPWPVFVVSKVLMR